MSRSLFLIVFLCLSLPAEFFAAQSIIRGTVKGLEGRELYILRYYDHLSERWFIEDQVTIGEDGSFSIQADVLHTELITIVSGAWQTDLFIRPEQTVELELHVPGDAVAKRLNENAFELYIKNTPEDDPNLILADFNQRYLEVIGESTYDLARYFGAGSSGFRSMHKEELLSTNMVTESGDSLTKADKRALIDSVNSRFTHLKTSLNTPLIHHPDTCTSHLLNAALGLLDLSLGRSPHEVWAAYLPRDGCQWWNPESVRLFESVHKLMTSHPDVKVSALFNAVKTGDLAKARDALVDYPLYGRPEGRDALILLTARNLWHEDLVYRNGVISMLNKLEAEPEQELLVRRLKEQLIEGTVYSDDFLPDITLLDHRSERVNLSTLEGSHIYLSVVILESAASQRELLLLEDLHRRHGRQIRFVTLVMDEDPDAMRNYLATHPGQDWMFAQAGTDPRLRRSFDLRTVPAFFMIRPDNRLYASQTLSPSEGAERMLVKAAGGDTREFNPWRDRQ